MRVVVLAGGHGGAKFTAGVKDLLGQPPSEDITVIGNTADDLILHGLNISPDLDTIMYTLGGGLDVERGWGRRDETFHANAELQAYGVPGTWFGLGDRDLATHLVRSQMRNAGYSLTDTTKALCVRWEPGVRLLPMSDDRVETHVIINDESGRRAVHFQEWWIRLHAEVPAEEFVFIGAAEATPGPEVVPAIMQADYVLVAPSNPVVSIAPILAVPGIRGALAQTDAPVIGVSPLIGGRAVRGMAEQCLASIGVEPDTAAVARHYGSRAAGAPVEAGGAEVAAGGLLDGWLMDTVDAPQSADLVSAGIAATATDLLMTDTAAAARIVEAAVRLADSTRR